MIIEENYNLLKKEIKLNLYKSDTLHNLENIFDLLENIYSNLSVLYSIDKRPNINEENEKSLEKLFGKKLPVSNEINSSEIDLIYNYHLKNIIENLNRIDNLLEA